MPIKQVFESAPGVYRIGLRSGLPDAWYNDAVDRLRLYDEYIEWVNGITVIENPESPTDYEMVGFFTNWERSAGLLEGVNTVAMRWSGLTGEFLGHDTRYNYWLLGVNNVTGGARGVTTAYPTHTVSGPADIYKLNPDEKDFELLHPAGYYGGVTSNIPVCIDVENDRTMLIGPSLFLGLKDSEVAVFQESTGVFLYKFFVIGACTHAFMGDAPSAYVVTAEGRLAVVDYVKGKVIGILHVGISEYERVWTWDRIAKRILSFERTPDTYPNGDCTCRIRGYYPSPDATGMAGPIPLQPPAKGERVEWITKVYGAAGEGVTGAVVNYALDNPAGAAVSPAQHTTDNNGNSRTFVTCSLAGDNELTATVEVPDAL